MMPGQMLPLDSRDQWLLAADPANEGQAQQWWQGPRPGARPTRVPGTLQETLGEYHGVAWYWRRVVVPSNPHVGGRYILRFWSVEYALDAWVNGQAVGHHQSSDTMVEFDVTAAVRPDAENQVAVRVVDPTNAPIDGLVIRECPGRNRVDPWSPGSCYNNGGLTDSVELLIAPAVRLESLYLKPDWQSGWVEADVNVRNATDGPAQGTIALSVSVASGGDVLAMAATSAALPPGDTLVHARVRVPEFQLWDVDHPALYRATARLRAAGSDSVDEKSATCGFRDFRFADGYFRLNGKRIFLKSAHFGGDAPMTCVVPLDTAWLRADFLQMKAMGFNMARCIAGLGKRYVMDLADEIGFLVYDESYAAWCVTPSAHLVERWNQSVTGMIRRDRNHPSVVIWGLLNETSNGPVFAHAVDSLALVKGLDDTRVVMLNSGRFDGLDGPPAARQRLPEAWVLGQAFCAPLVACNTSGADIVYDGTVFPAAAVALHVGPAGEPAALRFTAPAAGEYRVRAQFTGIAGPPANGPITTGAVFVVAQGKVLFADKINGEGRPNATSHECRLTLAKGATVDFLSGSGNETFNSDTTRADVVVEGPDGSRYDAAAQWSLGERDGGSLWSYGYLPAGSVNAAEFVPFVKAFDGVPRSIGGLSNPGATGWEDLLADKHPYQPCPHTADVIRTLRTIDGGGRPLFISEYGFGSANNLLHLLGHYHQATIDYAFDRAFLDDYFRTFSQDWERWHLADTFGNMENYFRQCIALEAQGRLLGTSAIRSNPHVISHSLTACHDTVLAAEGLTTSFREPKPGVRDAMSDAWSPLRFCVFAEPVQVVRGGSVHLECVLVNEDVLKPGRYPVRLQVLGPTGYRPLDVVTEVEIGPGGARPEPPFAQLVSARDVRIDGPAGCYRALALFDSGAAAEGGEYAFWVDDPATMPRVAGPVSLWGDDPALGQWLTTRGIATRPFGDTPTGRDAILVGRAPGADFAGLVRRITEGATAVFLCPGVFAQGDQPMALLPLDTKGSLVSVRDWLYQNNDWARPHPIFRDLPTGVLDYQFYREVLGEVFLVGQDPPDECVAGMINTSFGYASGLTVATHRLGKGRMILNTLRVRENLAPESSHPVAERLLRNLLSYSLGD